MDIYNVDNQNNLFGDDIDDILFNPVYFINQYESNKDNNINTNCEVHNSIDIQENKKHISLNSTFNTNNALDEEGSQNMNFHFSFFSFNNGNQQIEQKKEMSQKSIDILSEFISKEKKIVENKNNFIEIEEDKKIKLFKIKELKNNYEKLEKTLNIFFKKPFMRKNYEKKNFFGKYENNCDEKEKKINISDEIDIDIDEKKKKYKENNINFNNINNINEI